MESRGFGDLIVSMTEPSDYSHWEKAIHQQHWEKGYPPKKIIGFATVCENLNIFSVLKWKGSCGNLEYSNK